MEIPKLLWQTWKTKTVPDKWIESPQSVGQHLPDWEYRLTTDEENLAFVEKEFPELLELYRSFPREIYRVDMIRYLYLYRFGGVYIDLDIKLKRPLTDLFSSGGDLYLTSTPNLNGLTNSFMASTPGNPFWMRCIEEIKRRVREKPFYIFGDLQVLWTTGPGMITTVAREYDRPYSVIPYRLGHPCTICDHYHDRPCSGEESYIEELQGGSWSGGGAVVLHTVVCRWKALLLLLVFIIFLLLMVK